MDFLTSTIPTALIEQGLAHFQSEWLWALIVAFHLSFVFAFAMGANEVSNAFATSVGSGAITLKAAYCLATVVESAGGILLGYKVLETLRFKIIDLPMYENTPNELLMGQVAILIGCATWMMCATLFRLPVSSTHSHIGSIIGFSMVMRGTAGLHVDNVIKIIISWIISPALSGLITAVLYIVFDFAVLRRKDTLKCGFRALPGFYFFVFAFNTFVVTYHGSKWIGFDKTPFWMAMGMSVSVGLFAALTFQFILRSFMVRWVEKGVAVKQDDEDRREIEAGAGGASTATVVRLNTRGGSFVAAAAASNGTVVAGSADGESNNDSSNGALAHQLPPPNRTISTPHHVGRQAKPQHFSLEPKAFRRWLLPCPDRKEDPRTLRLFTAIQVFTGCFTGFSHGSKDIPNTIAPLATLLYVFGTVKVPTPRETPLWILAYGSLGTCIGFWMLGHRVIKTVGHEFTEINSFCGFTVELGAAITVLIAAKLGIPVSMTLCIVGSIVAVGAVRGKVPVNWALFRNVFLAWVCTFPLSGVFAACATLVLKYFFL